MAFQLVAIPKTYKAERKAKQRKAERQFTLTRAQVRAIVMDREKGCCERCGRKVDLHMFMMPRWWSSTGARLENEYARSKGMPICLSVDELIETVNAGATPLAQGAPESA